MKKLKIIMLLAILAVAILGCGQKEQTGKENETVVESETKTEENTEVVDVTDQYTEEELGMFWGLANAISEYDVIGREKISDVMVEELSDYTKQLISCFMMVYNDCEDLDSFEKMDLLMEAMIEQDGHEYNVYKVSEEQFALIQEYIWKGGLTNSNTVGVFLGETFNSAFVKYEDGTYGIEEDMDFGQTDVNQLSVFKVSKDTFYIEAETEYIIDEENTEISYITIIAEKNTESPFAGMTVTRIINEKEIDIRPNCVVEVNASDGFIDIRKEKEEDYHVISKIENGVQLEAFIERNEEGNAKWARVSYNGQRGWISVSQVEIVSYITYNQYSGKKVVYEQRVFTEEELEQARKALGVPDGLEVTYSVGETFYYEVGDCILTRISFYTENGYATATFDDDMDMGITVLPYTEDME